MEGKPPPSADTAADTRVSSTALTSTPSSASDRHDGMPADGGNLQIKSGDSMPRASVPPALAASVFPQLTAAPPPSVADREGGLRVDKEQGVQADRDAVKTGSGELPRNGGWFSAPAVGAPVQATAALAAYAAREWAPEPVARAASQNSGSEPGSGSGAGLSSAPTTTTTQGGERDGCLDFMLPSVSNTGAPPVWAVAPTPVPCASEKVEERLQIDDTGKVAKSAGGDPSPSQPAANTGASVFDPRPSEIGVGWGGSLQVGAAAAAAVSASSPLSPTAALFAPRASATGGASRGGQQVTATGSRPAPPQASSAFLPYWSEAESSAGSATSVPLASLLSESASRLPPRPPSMGQFWPKPGPTIGSSQSGASAAPTTSFFSFAPRPPGAGLAVGGSHQVGEARSVLPPPPSRVEEAVNDGEEVNAAASVP